MKLCISSLFLLLILLVSNDGFAQKKDYEPELNHEIGIFTGPFLISNAQEILPAAGGRLSWAFKRSHLELQALGANVGGVSYYLGEINWRKQFNFHQLGGLFLFGFDWHYVRSRTASTFTSSRGWHVGTGLNVKINNNIYFRNDYVLRFGVNRALVATLGLSFSFGGGKKK